MIPNQYKEVARLSWKPDFPDGGRSGAKVSVFDQNVAVILCTICVLVCHDLYIFTAVILVHISQLTETFATSLQPTD